MSGVAMPETAMLLAAGLGTRMRPLTHDRPKPMIEVAGRTLIDRLLDMLVAAGVQHAVVNVHWKADMLRRHLSGRSDIEIVISDETDRLLETGGGLARARPLLGDAPVFVLNTDAIWEPATPAPLQRLASAFDPDRMDECLLLARTEASLGYDGPGDFLMDGVPGALAGRLTRRGAAPSAPWAFAGVRIMQPSLYDDEPAEPFSANRVWDRVLAAGRLFGLPLDASWLHVGDPGALAAAEARLAEGTTPR